jgi:hypothetical protein
MNLIALVIIFVVSVAVIWIVEAHAVYRCIEDGEYTTITGNVIQIKRLKGDKDEQK